MGYPPAALMQPFDAICDRPGADYRYRWNEFQTFVQRTVASNPGVRVFGFEGANRLGKTGAVVNYLRVNAKHNPGERGLWLVPSLPWFKAFGKPAVEQLCTVPRKGTRAYECDIRLSSPVTIRFKRWRSEIIVHSYDILDRLEGGEFAFIAMDEAQLQGADALSLALSRLSAKRAKHPSILITGIATPTSWVSDTLAEMKGALHFDGFATHINAANLLDGYVDTLADNLSEDEALFRIYGKKPIPSDRVFSEFVEAAYPTGNLIAFRYDPRLPTIAMFDPGHRRSALLLMQRMLDGSMILFDELMCDDRSTEAVIADLETKAVPRAYADPTDLFAPNGQRIGRYVFDELAIDSAGDAPSVTTGRSCVQAFRARWPKLPVNFNASDRDRTKRTYRIKAAFASGPSERRTRRLLVCADFWHRSLSDRRKNHEGSRVGKSYGRGIAHAIRRLKYPRTSGGRLLSDAYQECPVDGHAMDALGYGLLSQENRRMEVLPRR